MLISLDTETTGFDFHHGCRPYMVTTCSEEWKQRSWEWEVDPIDRSVKICPDDVDEIRQYLEDASEIVFHNAKFDVTALRSAGIIREWDWSKVHDTLIAGHLLESNQPHNLTKMVVRYLGRNIEPFEDALEEACHDCRKLARKAYRYWRIAKAGDPLLPSIKKTTTNKDEKGWKADGWLPKLIATRKKLPANHLWHTVLKDYANTDSASTLSLWLHVKRQLHRMGLWEIYLERLKVLEVIHDMEWRGVTVSKTRLQELYSKHTDQAKYHGRICVNLAKTFDYDLSLPKSGNNDSLRHFCFGSPVDKKRPELGVVKDKSLALKVVGTTDAGFPSLDKDALEIYENTLDSRSRQGAFIHHLLGKRGFDTSISYMDGYQRYWLPLRKNGLWYVLRPNLNPTGTDTLRMSSNNPNAQNISKKEKANVRYCFGPEDGWEWWSLDAQNIELRIPAFECGEPTLCDVFLRPKEAPYFGSYHLVIFDALHPKLFAKHGVACKDLFESTWYQWVKNGNFAMIYGAQQAKADLTYHVPGAFNLIRNRFPRIAQLSDRMKAIANRLGYVETIPDKSVNSQRGYPLWCTRTERGDVLPTTPLNYHVQSTACWWMMKAMIRCHRRLAEWRREGFDAYICLQIHDELVFAMPKGKVHPHEDLKLERAGKQLPRHGRSNLWRIRMLQKLMEMGGNDIGIPTPVGVEYNEHNWADMVKC